MSCMTSPSSGGSSADDSSAPTSLWSAYTFPEEMNT